MFPVRCFSLTPLPGEVGRTGIELSELRQDRSADFSPLPAVLAGPERGGLKSALLNSMAVGGIGGGLAAHFLLAVWLPYPFNFRSSISPTTAGFAFPWLNFITWPLRKFSAAVLPDL